MIPAPHTYAAWAATIDLFRNKTDDADVLDAMRQGTLEWQAGVAERFVRRLTDAVTFRMNAAIDKFQKDYSRSRGQETAVVQALLTLRRELSFLARALDLPALPERERAQCRELVHSTADDIQKSLEDSAHKSDRSGRLESLVRSNRVNAL